MRLEELRAETEKEEEKLGKMRTRMKEEEKKNRKRMAALVTV